MLSIIIPTIQKDNEILYKLVETLSKDKIVGEILIINNAKQNLEFNCAKIKIIKPFKNLYVNGSWNLGIKKCKYDYFGIINDDLILPINLCSLIYPYLQDKKTGLIGLDSNNTKTASKEELVNIEHISRINVCPMYKIFGTEFWGSAIFGHKNNYYPIPSNIKVWCGDNYLLFKNKENKKINYELKGLKIKHLGENSSGSINLSRIKRTDMNNFSKIVPEFKNEECFKLYKNPNFLAKIFSLKNENNHKVITILGIKIKFYKYNKPGYKKKYFDYLLNYSDIKSPYYRDITDSPYSRNNDDVKLLAFYLPQFHSFEENDKWHGRGFSEWTKTTQAQPQFSGHYQPQCPIDVGYYNLETDYIMHRQIKLAKMYGIYGFCFHYYWFSGKRLMEKPIFNYLKNSCLDLPFCFCWANENWTKLWDGGNKEILIEQKLEDNDSEKFYNDIKRFFADKRYIKIDNKPLLIIYRPQLFENFKFLDFIRNLRQYAKEDGFKDLYIAGAKSFSGNINPCDWELDAMVEFPPHVLASKCEKLKIKSYIKRSFKGTVFNISKYINEKRYIQKTEYPLFKTVFPNWDNTARKAKTNAWIFQTEPPEYKQWLKDCIMWSKENNDTDKRFVFINAWNEWAEGAHLEPCEKYGYAYLEETKNALGETK